MKDETKSQTTIKVKSQKVDEKISILVSSKLNIVINKDEESYKIELTGLNKNFDTNNDTRDKKFETVEEAKNMALELLYRYLNQERLKKSLQSENLIVLTGAGSSMESGGKSMSGLWDCVSDKAEDFEKIVKEIKYQNEGQKNLEDLLSNIEIEDKSRKNKGDDNSTTNSFIKQANDLIATECNLTLEEDAPHPFFISNLIKARKKNNQRIKIFTLNYDTLFEKAADKIGAIVIDGFSFSQNKEFQGTNFDLDIVQREKTRINNEDNFYNKVFHLYKIHGSIDWCFDSKQKNITKTKDKNDCPFLIYPNSSKFEKSYEMPFFEMISRFQASLRKENTTLFVIGYGFGDEHINRILEEAIKNNLNLETYIVKPNINNDSENEKIKKYFSWIEKGTNDLYLISDKFGNFSKNLPSVQLEDPENNRSQTFNNKGDE